jgi:hypothetical protein
LRAQFSDGYLPTRSDMAFCWDNYQPARTDIVTWLYASLSASIAPSTVRA